VVVSEVVTQLKKKWFDREVPCRFFPAKPVAVLEFAILIVVENNGLPRVLFD